MEETFEKDLEMGIEKFVRDLKIYELQGRDIRFFWSDLRVTAKDGGQNVSAVAKAFVNSSCRVYLAHRDTMLANPWDGELSTISTPLEDGEEYLIRVHLL